MFDIFRLLNVRKIAAAKASCYQVRCCSICRISVTSFHPRDSHSRSLNYRGCKSEIYVLGIEKRAQT